MWHFTSCPVLSCRADGAPLLIGVVVDDDIVVNETRCGRDIEDRRCECRCRSVHEPDKCEETKQFACGGRGSEKVVTTDRRCRCRCQRRCSRRRGYEW